MIPEKDHWYKIKYIDPVDSEHSYSGIGIYNGFSESSENFGIEDYTGLMYHFDLPDLKDEVGFGIFSEKDIIEEIDNV